MEISVYEQTVVFDELKNEWNELLQRSSSNRIFSTWEWLSAWWDAYCPGSLWVLVCRGDDGRIEGLAPWFIENHPVLKRVVRSIGCVEVTDYLDLIVDKDHEDEVLASFAEYARNHHEKYDTIDLCNLPEESIGHTRFPDALQAQGFTVTLKQQEVCPIIPLPDTWEGYLETLDKKQRHELRRKIRRAEGATENIEWYIVGKEHNLQEELERFLRLMAASQIDKATFLNDPQNVAFFKQVMPLMFENNWLQLNFLTINGEAAATYLNFVYGERVLVYNSGLLPNDYGQLSAGIVLLARNIRHAIEKGYKLFDFLRGNETYKYRMGGQDTKVYMLRAEIEG